MTRPLPRLRLALVLTLLGVLAAPAAYGDVGADVLNALKKGLKSKAPELKLKAITDVGRFAGHLDAAEKKRAAALLNRAFAKQTDQETRRAMIRALARLHHVSGWVPVITAALDEKDAVVRKTARLEVLGGRADLLAAMGELIQQEKNAAYKASLVFLLGDRRRKDAAPLLIGLLADRKRMVQAAAVESLEAISGKAHGYSASKWRLWHARWLKTRPARGESGPSVAPTHEAGTEPPPHVSRSLHPSFYGLRLRSKDIVFVLDISGSVGSDGVRGAKRKLVEAVELLASDVNVSAIFFSDKIEYWKQGQMLRATPANKADLVFFLRGLAPGRRTDVFSAFNAGLKILERQVLALAKAGITRKEPATLVAVSDGRDNMGQVPIHVIEERLDRLDLERTVVHSIVLGGKPSKIMRMLAYYGSGKYIVVPSDR